MASAAAAVAPEVPAIVADLLGLPFDRGAFAGIWASKAHQHLPAAELPIALAEAHRTLRTGGRLELTLFPTREVGAPTIEEVTSAAAGDDLPGRLFTWWGPDHLRTVVEAAGFALDYRELDPDIFGGQLKRRAYADAERIAAVGAVVTRRA